MAARSRVRGRGQAGRPAHLDHLLELAQERYRPDLILWLARRRRPFRVARRDGPQRRLLGPNRAGRAQARDLHAGGRRSSPLFRALSRDEGWQKDTDGAATCCTYCCPAHVHGARGAGSAPRRGAATRPRASKNRPPVAPCAGVRSHRRRGRALRPPRPRAGSVPKILHRHLSYADLLRGVASRRRLRPGRGYRAAPSAWGHESGLVYLLPCIDLAQLDHRGKQ